MQNVEKKIPASLATNPGHKKTLKNFSKESKSTVILIKTKEMLSYRTL